MSKYLSLLLLLLISACQPQSSSNTQSLDIDTLSAYRWQLIAISSAQEIPEKAELVPYLDFLPENKVSGYLGCNRFQSAISLQAGSAVFGPVMSSKRYCMQSMALEMAFAEALKQTAAMEINGKVMTLKDASGQVLLTFQGKSH